MTGTTGFRFRQAGVAFALLFCLSRLAHASFNPSPPSLALFPHQVGNVTVTITFPPAAGSGTGNIAFTGLPANTFVYQGNSFTVQFSWTAGSTSSTASFSLTSSSNVVPGTYPVTMAEAVPTLGAGTGVLNVQFRYASMTATAAPNPATLVAGGSSQSVQVSTVPDPGLDTCIAYSLSGFPAFIQTGSAPLTCEPSFPPVAIPITATSAATAGTYNGQLVAQYADNLNNPVTRQFPFTITILQRDIMATFAQRSMNLCPGAPPVANSIQLAPVNGYSGTPTLTFTSIPNGLSISPPNPVSPPLPPAQSIPFSVAAPGNQPAGASMATLHVADAAAQVNKDVHLALQVLASDFAASAMPTTIPLVPGGGSQALTAAVVPNGCFTGTVSVTPSGVPTGVAFSPPTLSIGPPFPPVSFQVSASPGASSGSYPVTLTFAGSNGSTHTAPVTLVLAATSDFALSVSPPQLSLTRSQTGQVTVSVTGVNGFSTPVSVTAPSIPGVAFSPAAFSVPANESRAVSVSVSSQAATGVYPAVFRGTASGIFTPRIATLSLSILGSAPPPEITSLTPPATTPGVVGLVVRLGGQNFQPGASVSSTVPGLRIEATAVLSSTLADLRLSTSADLPAGRYPLTMVNPDGGRSDGSAALLVYPRSSLGAPLGVTDAAIVFPPEGTLIASGEAVYPRGLLATTGTGTIVASWTIDGTPFDRVTATVTAGWPTEIRANVPIPSLAPGDHQVALRIETPRLDTSPSIQVVATLESSSRLRLLAPREGAVLPASGSRFRWSLVPFASGYEVLVRRKGQILPVRFRSARADWTPSPQDLERIGPGIREWSVRPIFPGEVPGEPTASRRFALLPSRVELTLLPGGVDPATGRSVVRWSGGIAGLLYRVEFVRSGTERSEFSALTPRQEYRLPRGSRFAAPEYAVRVTAYGPGGLLLGQTPLSPGRTSALPRPPVSLARQEAEIAITSIEPADGASVSDASPLVAVHWNRAVPETEIVLILDATDVTAVSAITTTSLEYRPLLPLVAGRHEAVLALAGTTRSWSFSTGPAAEAGAAGEAAPPAPGEAPAATPVPPEIASDWGVTLLGTIIVVDGAAPEAPDTARLQLSTQGDLSSETLAAKFTGDVSVRHDLDPPENTVQESRNWLVDLGAGRLPYRQEARVGFAPPRFMDGAEILTAGLARGAVEARASSSVGALSYYHSFDSLRAGVSAGTFGPSQQVDAFALETPGAQDRFFLRAIGLRADTEATSFTAGGRGDMLGLLGRYTASPAFSVTFEGAYSDFNPAAAGATRIGWAFRLGFSGLLGTFQYTANVRYTDADFVNPANPGYTPGGISNRTGGDLSLTKSFGMSSLGLQYRHVEGGTTSGSTTPSSSEDGGNLSFQTLLSQKVTLSVSGNLTQDRGGADPTLSLPETNRLQYGATATAMETAGAISFSQTYAYQRLDDRIQPTANSIVQTATINATGTLLPGFSLSALASGTRSEGSATVGTTDQLLLSVQPIIAIPAIWVSFQPRASYTETKSSLSAAHTYTEQYQALLSIGPPWLRSLFSLQFSGDWSRSRTSGQPSPAFTSRLSATLTVRWGAGGGAAAPPATVLPGSAPFSPVSGPAGNPGGQPW
jgi:hypothetical protein